MMGKWYERDKGSLIEWLKKHSITKKGEEWVSEWKSMNGNDCLLLLLMEDWGMLFSHSFIDSFKEEKRGKTYLSDSKRLDIQIAEQRDQRVKKEKENERDQRSNRN